MKYWLTTCFCGERLYLHLLVGTVSWHLVGCDSTFKEHPALSSITTTEQLYCASSLRAKLLSQFDFPPSCSVENYGARIQDTVEVLPV